VRRTTSLLLIFALLCNGVLAGSALVDGCCSPAEPGVLSITDVHADGNGDGHEGHAAHCCHVNAHYSAMIPATSLAESRLSATWPRDAGSARASLCHAPPVPPPNV